MYGVLIESHMGYYPPTDDFISDQRNNNGAISWGAVTKRSPDPMQCRGCDAGHVQIPVGSWAILKRGHGLGIHFGGFETRVVVTARA